MEQRNLTLLTDLYGLTTMQGYFKEKDASETIILDVFYGTNPHDNGFAIYAGLQQVIEYVEGLHSDDNGIEHLRSLGMFKEDLLNYLREFRFTGDTYAILGGTVIFPREPLVRVIASIIWVQLIETVLLNIINYQSPIVTEIECIVYAARGNGIMEFGLRRVQGPNADTCGVRAAMIARCIGTSNVLCGRVFNVPVKEVHAHGWIMNFPDGLTTFRTYAKLHPFACILLMDTYDTLGPGIPNVIRVFKGMRDADIPFAFYGICLDGGDLTCLSKKAEKVLSETGSPDAVTSASSDLDENLINSLRMQGVTINSWDVGTNLITAKDCPSLGGVYKLVVVMDKATGQFVPKIRPSENTEKITNPGNKATQRVCDRATGKIIADSICLVGEEFDTRNSLLLFSPLETWKETMLAPDSYTMRELVIPIFLNGGCMYQLPKVMDIRVYYKKELDTPRDGPKRLINLYTVHVDLSNELWHAKNQLLDSYHRK